MLNGLSRRAGHRRAAVLLAAIASLGGCGSGGTEPGSNAAGTYQLEAIDSYALPVLIHNGPWVDRASGAYYNSYVVQVTSATIVLDGGEFTVSFDGLVSANGQQHVASLSTYGTYDIDGEDIVLTPQTPVMLPVGGSIGGGLVALDIDLIGSGYTSEYTFRR